MSEKRPSWLHCCNGQLRMCCIVLGTQPAIFSISIVVITQIALVSFPLASRCGHVSWRAQLVNKTLPILCLGEVITLWNTHTHTHNLKFFGAHKSKISQKAAQLQPQKSTHNCWPRTGGGGSTTSDSGVDPVPGNACVQSCLVKNLNWTHRTAVCRLSRLSAANWENCELKKCAKLS